MLHNLHIHREAKLGESGFLINPLIQTLHELWQDLKFISRSAPSPERMLLCKSRTALDPGAAHHPLQVQPRFGQ